MSLLQAPWATSEVQVRNIYRIRSPEAQSVFGALKPIWGDLAGPKADLFGGLEVEPPRIFLVLIYLGIFLFVGWSSIVGLLLDT